MTGFQIIALAGAMAGLGLWLLVSRLAPVHADLAESLAMLAPVIDPGRPDEVQGWEAVGAWGMARLPEGVRPVPTKDLALLSMTPTAFLARKIMGFLIGLLLPGVTVTVLILMGVHVPWAVPVLLACAVGALGFLLPDLDVRAKAAGARAEFTRALACFIDLVALERSCGSGAKQALDTAAGVGDSWVFHRLRECLDRSTWAGLTGWDGLRELGAELDVGELCDVADIMRLSGAEGAGVYRILRAKARSMREGILLTDMTRANETNEKMSVPVSLLGIVFLAILIGPALLNMTGVLP